MGEKTEQFKRGLGNVAGFLQRAGERSAAYHGIDIGNKTTTPKTIKETKVIDEKTNDGLKDNPIINDVCGYSERLRTCKPETKETIKPIKTKIDINNPRYKRIRRSDINGA